MQMLINIYKIDLEIERMFMKLIEIAGSILGAKFLFDLSNHFKLF